MSEETGLTVAADPDAKNGIMRDIAMVTAVSKIDSSWRCGAHQQ
jgi:hypothetical protein